MFAHFAVAQGIKHAAKYLLTYFTQISEISSCLNVEKHNVPMSSNEILRFLESYVFVDISIHKHIHICIRYMYKFAFVH